MYEGLEALKPAYTSVADQGVYPPPEFSIPGRIRIRVKEFKYFQPQKIFTKLSEISSRISNPGFFPIPDPLCPHLRIRRHQPSLPRHGGRRRLLWNGKLLFFFPLQKLLTLYQYHNWMYEGLEALKPAYTSVADPGVYPPPGVFHPGSDPDPRQRI